MSQQLISLNSDLQKLQDEGYELEVTGTHLLVKHIPYVNPAKEVKSGVLVCIFTLAAPTKLATPADHTIFFCGETPCNADGTVMTAIINNSQTQQLADGILVDHFFSSRPVSGKFENYYEKVRTYAEILSSQAKVIDKTVTAKPNQKKL